MKQMRVTRLRMLKLTILATLTKLLVFLCPFFLIFLEGSVKRGASSKVRGARLRAMIKVEHREKCFDDARKFVARENLPKNSIPGYNVN